MHSADSGRDRRGQAGFTMGELVFVVIIVSIITLLAYPAMKTLTNSNASTDTATKVSHRFNQMRGQSKRRNRPIVVDFRHFSANTPGGRIDFREGRSASCARVAIDLDEGGDGSTAFLDSIPVGGVEVPGYRGPNPDDIGYSGWRLGEDGEISTERVRLCINPDGGIYRLAAGTSQQLEGVLELLVQAYESGDLGRSKGGARRVRFILCLWFLLFLK